MISLRRALLVSLVAAVGVGAAGVVGAQNVVDTQRPSAPEIITGYATGPDRAYLEWTRARDIDGVVEYRVLRNLVEIKRFVAANYPYELSGLFYDLPPGNSYFQVVAVDAAGNESVRSAPVVVHLDNSRLKPPTNVEIVNYDGLRRCTTVRFDASVDERVVGYTVLENLGHAKGVSIIDGATEYEVEYCNISWGDVKYVQVVATSIDYGDSVRTAPVTVFKHYGYAPKGFDVAVDGSTVTMEWDESPYLNGAVAFVVIDSGQTIVETEPTATGATVELEPGRHALQLFTVNEFGNRSRKSAPIIFNIGEPST